MKVTFLDCVGLCNNIARKLKKNYNIRKADNNYLFALRTDDLSEAIPDSLNACCDDIKVMYGYLTALNRLC